jgi:recombination protein RecA
MTKSTPNELTKMGHLVEVVNKAYGDNTIMLPELGGELVSEHYEVISTGSTEVDNAIGVGGLPMGKITEVLGQESSGKTTLALHVIANAQKKGLRCAFIDTEQSLDSKRAIAIGVDFDKLIISQPDNAEQALDLLDLLVRSGEVKVIVLDSVAALVPKAEIEGESSDAIIGVAARLMGKAMRKVAAPANKNKVLVLFTNQIRQKIGGFGFGPQETTPGGNALKFYATLRIDCRRTGNNKKGDKLVSTNHKIVIKKNKLAPPMGVALVKIDGNGFMQGGAVTTHDEEALTE